MPEHRAKKPKQNLGRSICNIAYKANIRINNSNVMWWSTKKTRSKNDQTRTSSWTKIDNCSIINRKNVQTKTHKKLAKQSLTTATTNHNRSNQHHFNLQTNGTESHSTAWTYNLDISNNDNSDLDRSDLDWSDMNRSNCDQSNIDRWNMDQSKRLPNHQWTVKTKQTLPVQPSWMGSRPPQHQHEQSLDQSNNNHSYALDCCVTAGVQRYVK